MRKIIFILSVFIFTKISVGDSKPKVSVYSPLLPKEIKVQAKGAIRKRSEWGLSSNEKVNGKKFEISYLNRYYVTDSTGAFPGDPILIAPYHSFLAHTQILTHRSGWKEMRIVGQFANKRIGSLVYSRNLEGKPEIYVLDKKGEIQGRIRQAVNPNPSDNSEWFTLYGPPLDDADQFQVIAQFQKKKSGEWLIYYQDKPFSVDHIVWLAFPQFYEDNESYNPSDLKSFVWEPKREQGNEPSVSSVRKEDPTPQSVVPSVSSSPSSSSSDSQTAKP